MVSCLVIVDVQVGFLNACTAHIPKRLVDLLNSRSFDHIVATKFVNTANSPFVRLLDWHDLLDERRQALDSVALSAAERVFVKTGYSCFTQEFADYIEDCGIDMVYFVGIDTDGCVLMSATDCFLKGIPFEVLTSYCASTGGVDCHEAALVLMRRMFGDSRVIVEV